MVEEPFLDKSSEEIQQSTKRRQELLRKLEDAVGRTAVAFFTSQTHAVVINQNDADMLEEVLRQSDLRSGLCLVLDTAGGDGISAERIVRICRVYSKNRFDVFVARRAKSAGTIIAMGADRIFMGETSALGRIDPQIVVEDKNRGHYVMPAHVVVKSFDYLVNKTRVAKGNVQSFLQLLSNYDAKEIEFIRRQLRMNEDIAFRALKQGMWAEMSEKEMKKKIAPFVRAIVTKAHARDIFFDEAQKAGLKIELVCHSDPIWSVVCDYYTLAWDFVTTKYSKLIESTDSHFSLAEHGKISN